MNLVNSPGMAGRVPILVQTRGIVSFLWIWRGVYLLVMCISETTEVARDSFANLFPVVQPKWNRQYFFGGETSAPRKRCFA